MLKLALQDSETLRAEVPFDHFEKMTGILENTFPEELKFEDKSDFLAWAKESLPLIKWNECSSFPCSLVVQLLCLKNGRLQIEAFFPDLLRRWIIPGKEASILSFNHMYFYPKDLPDTPFFIGELKILIETSQEWHDARTNLGFLAKEISLALISPSHATSILVKRISSNQHKTIKVHQELNNLMFKFPYQIEESILDGMGHFFALSSKEFVKQRQPHHLTRLITSIYLFHKSLFRSITYSPGMYPIELRFLPAVLEFPFGYKPVLGCVIGISLVEDYEILEEKHILLAIRKLIPQVEIVKGSSYFYEQKEEKIKILYVELEKRNGHLFSLSEPRELKLKLKEKLRNSIEKLMPPIFMIRNEEEVLRSILMLRREIHSKKDLPQVIISLEQQTKDKIIFTVIWVSIRKTDSSSSLQMMLEKGTKKYSFTFDRQQIVGYLRKKDPIEAHVFRLSLPKDPSFLRSDLSLNFYLAREKAASFLNKILGEFRDYNGGIILKQNEILTKLKQEFRKMAETDSELLEDFFYSISPIEKQATIDFSFLRILFELLLHCLCTGLNSHLDYLLKTREEDSSLFLVILCRDHSLREQLTLALGTLNCFDQNLIFSDLNLKEVRALSYIFKLSTLNTYQQILNVIENTVKNWRKKAKDRKIFKVSISYTPTSLDPRLAGDEFTGGILRLLFEGLMRINREGHFEYGMAESVSISADQKHYRFKLRKAKWSNGTPVTAHDFEYGWKTILSPHSKAAFGYLFYPIKNAKETKQGLIPLQELGVKALDERTLDVELAFPTPYFLELTAHTIYSPIHHKIDSIHPNWSLQSQEGYICNGGFQLKTHYSNQHYEFIKNPHYWDTESIELDKIIFSKTPYQSNQRQQEMDLLGQPFGLLDPARYPAEDEEIQVCPDTGVYWYVFNTQRFPFHHLKLRLAFALAIHRINITSSLSTPARPAHSPLQPFLSRYRGHNLLEESLLNARQLFEEALVELNLTKETFPLLTILYGQGGIRDQTAVLIKQQWEAAFKIQCRLEPLEWRLAFDKMKRGDFSICGIVWKSLVNDPIYVLNSFRFSNEQLNLGRWEKEEYQNLLEKADHELNFRKRAHYLAQAEELLIKEVPILPLFYTDFRALVKKRIQLPKFSNLGIMDLKWTKLKDL